MTDGMECPLLALDGVEEGIELNVLGRALGIGFRPPAVKLPGIGNVPPRKARNPSNPMSA